MAFDKITSIIRNKTIGNIGFYFIGNIAKSILPFIILPFLTLYMVPAQFGTWNVFNAILSLATPFTALGLAMVIGRNYHLVSREELAETIFLATAKIFLFCTLLTFIIGVVSFYYDAAFGIPMPYLMVIPILCFFVNFTYLNKIVLRHERKAWAFVLLDFGVNFVSRFGGLLCVIFISATWLSLFGAHFAAYIFFAFIAFYLFTKDKFLKPNMDKSKSKELLKIGLPLMPHAVGGVILTLCDRLILERMTDADTVGIYSVGASLGAAALLFCTAFNNSWGPWFHHQMKNMTADKKQKIVRYSYLYFALTIVLSFAVFGAGTLYIYWFIDPAYHGAVPVLLWVALGTGFYGLSFVITHYLIVLGKTSSFPIITGLSAALNIALTIYLVRSNGMIGAAQATCISYAVFFMLMWWQSQKHYPMPWIRALKGKRADGNH